MTADDTIVAGIARSRRRSDTVLAIDGWRIR